MAEGPRSRLLTRPGPPVGKGSSAGLASDEFRSLADRALLVLLETASKGEIVVDRDDRVTTVANEWGRVPIEIHENLCESFHARIAVRARLLGPL
jgi:hypothetical protein